MHFKYTRPQLEQKPLPELRRISRQIGASWEIGDDQRRKANWVKAILNHQSTIQERLPEEPSSQFFTEITTDAQVGDYFRIPFRPIVQVTERTESATKDKVSYTVATVTGQVEEWEVALKTEPQPSAPAVDPLDKPFDELVIEIEPVTHEITVQEKLSGIWLIFEGAVLRGSFYQSSVTRMFVANDKPYRSKSEAVRAIVGHCPGGLFPGEKIIQPNYPLLIHCADCGGHGCGNCGYTGLKANWDGTQEYWFRYYDTLEDDDRGSGRRCYRVFHQGCQVGVVMQVRNPAEKWDNTPNSYYYVIGDGRKYSSVEEAAVSLNKLVHSPVS